MEGFFKFLSAQPIDRMILDGTVRISTLAHFRGLEGSQWIADRNEGVTNVKVTNAAVRSGEGGAQAGEPWRPHGFHPIVQASGNSRIGFDSCIFSYAHPEVYVFCFSVGNLETLTQAMCRDAAVPYDACVRIIVPPELLAHRLLNRGSIIELGDKPAKHYFARFSAQAVTYDWREHQHSAGQAPAPSPFQKDPFFQSQSEFRIVLYPKSPMEQQHLTIRLPHPEKVFSEEFREVPSV